MVRRTPGFGRGRGKPRKHGLPPRICDPPTIYIVPASTTPASDASSVPPGLHTQEFVMIPNPGYVESGPQPSFF